MDQTHREREHFFRAAKVVALLTLLSRAMGMLRDMAITWLGASRATDAFQMAFAIPNLFRRLFGEGALSGAFVPVFTDAAENSGFDKAGRLFANALGLLGAFLSALMVVLLVALLAWAALFPGQWDRRLLLGLLSVMLPFMVTICLLALGAAALNCRGQFLYPAAAPILLNVFMILAALVIAPRWKEHLQGRLYVIAASVTAAGVVQLAGILMLLRRGGFPIRPRLVPVEPGIKRMLKLMAPMLLGFGFLQISSLFDLFVAWVLAATEHAPNITIFGQELAKPLSAGVLVRVGAANRLYQFPMGVLAISLGVAVFPLLSRYAARGDMPNLRLCLNRALRLSMMEGLATGVGMFLLAEPIIRLIYEHGNFTAGDSREAARALRMYLLGMWAYCSYQIFVRAFYSLKDSTTPLKVSSALIVLYMAIVLSGVWAPWLGAAAFGLAAATTASINVLILTLLLRRRLGRFGGRNLAASVARSLAACAVMAALLQLMLRQMAGLPNWLVVAACVPAGAAAFILTAWLLRSPELGELLGSILRRQAPQPQPTETETANV